MSQIDLVLTVTPQGEVIRISSTGHAIRSGDQSVPCALVSAQLRSFGLLVSGNRDLSIRGRLDTPGQFQLEVLTIASESKQWYRGSSAALIQFLSDSAREFPTHIKLSIETERQET